MPNTLPLGRPLVAYIDQKAFLDNLAYASSLSPESEVLVVLKADAYGHGIVDISRLVPKHRLAVASSREALRIFDAGLDNEVVLLEGPFNSECLDMLDQKPVVWAVHSVWQLELLLGADKPVSVWLKLNTGMNRLGLSPEAYKQALAIISRNANKIELTGFMSHFASADDASAESVNVQMARFHKTIEESGCDKPLSFANSGGILYYPKARLDIVRPGIMLYGGSPNPSDRVHAKHLKPVMHLESEVIALHDVAEGESVGYGDTWIAKRSSRIATVAVGYGDGYPRHAPSGTPVIVDGQQATLAGRVSRDMISVDVTDIPSADVGSSVQLWGDLLSADVVAEAAQTISYELFTQVTMRVPRVLR
jgi:alanine racemase